MTQLDASAILAAVAVLTIFGAGVAWLMRLQNQLDGKLSYARHEEICLRTHQENIDVIRELKELVEKSEKDAREDRHALRNELHMLAVKVEGIGTRVMSIATIQKEDRR